MADDLISRQAAIKLLRGECVAKYPSSFCFGLCAAADELSKLSAADAVEVVRCKDCKHFTPCKEVEGVSWTGFCNYGEFHTDEDDYCSRGERREENGT